MSQPAPAPAPTPPEPAPDQQPCPACGLPMAALRGGTATICPNCGFKDSCCF